MITGDNPLTACHIAKELKMTRKSQTLILSEPDKTMDSWQWVSVDGEHSVELSSRMLPQLKEFDLCITGKVSDYLPILFPVLCGYVCLAMLLCVVWIAVIYCIITNNCKKLFFQTPQLSQLFLYTWKF